MQSSNKETTSPVTINLSDKQFEQMDKFGLVLKSELNEISVPARNSMEVIADNLNHDEPDELTLVKYRIAL